LLLPQPSDEALRQVAIRLRAELFAAGLRVTSETIPLALSPRLAMELAADRGADALVLLRKSADGRTETWVSEGVGSAITHARFAAESATPEDQRQLTVQVADFLRARVASLAFRAEEPTPTNEVGQAKARPSEVPAPPPRRKRVAVVGGALLAWHARPAELAAMPSLGLAFRSEPPNARALPIAYGVALTFAGYVPQTSYETDEGRASVHHGLGVLEADLAFARGPVQPGGLVGAGVYGVGVQGQASSPYRGDADQSFSALLTAGLFVEARTLRWLGLRAVGRAMHAPGRTHVEITQREVVRMGGSMLSLALEARIWLR
jgi:hypothetical protein